MRKSIGLIFVFTVLCHFGFSQNRQTPIGTANLSNGGTLSVMAVKEVTSEKPDEGHRFVAFDIFFDNSSGNSDIPFSSVYNRFEVKDANGYSYKGGFMSYDLIKPALPNDTTVEQGDILRGFLTFQILQDAPINTLQIRFRSNSIQSEWVKIR
jgi:hypothetical protein